MAALDGDYRQTCSNGWLDFDKTVALLLVVGAFMDSATTHAERGTT